MFGPPHLGWLLFNLVFLSEGLDNVGHNDQVDCGDGQYGRGDGADRGPVIVTLQEVFREKIHPQWQEEHDQTVQQEA